MEREVVIIGGGFAGICMAIKLREMGIENIAILEKGADVGGTWFYNRYPGAACDVPSMLYSFSFAPNPNWTRRFAAQPEIEGYIHWLVDKYHLRPLYCFNTSVKEARFKQGGWQVSTEQGDTLHCRFLISAVGQLNHPQLPDIKGIDSFNGESWHSARWRQDIDLTGKRVGVIGNAASAVQLIPEVAKIAAHVEVFQRTPNYLIPRMDRSFFAFERWLFKKVPVVMKWYRLFTFLLGEGIYYPVMRRKAWAKKFVTSLASWQLNHVVKDTALAKAMTPDFPIGCKRILMCDDYYPAMIRQNVNLNTATIESIDATGVKTVDGHVDCDYLIYATGFRSNDFLRGMNIYGRGGKSLQKRWDKGAFAYRSVCTADFPNFFMLYGPNSNLGSNSIIAMIEAQVGYIISLLRSKKTLIEVKHEAESDYQVWLNKSLSETVWDHGCKNWYRNEYGRQPNNWPLSVMAFQRHMKEVNWFDFAN